MSYDIHLADSQKNAESMFPVISIDEDEHEHFFFSSDLSQEYKYLNKMSDYYADATYHGEEIDLLLKDLHQLKDSKGNKIDDILGKLIDLCIKAKEENLNIFCFCD